MADQVHGPQAKWDALKEFIWNEFSRAKARVNAMDTATDEKPLPLEFDGGMICGHCLALQDLLKLMLVLETEPVEFDESGRGLPLNAGLVFVEKVKKEAEDH